MVTGEPRDPLAGPGSEFRYAGAAGSVGFITPLSHTFCGAVTGCGSRPRASSGCASSARRACDLRAPLRAGATVPELRALVLDALKLKPESHHLALGYSGPEAPITMSQIGG